MDTDLENLWKDFETFNTITISKNSNDKNCKNCGTDSKKFITDHKSGDVICTECGTVAVERFISDEPE